MRSFLDPLFKLLGGLGALFIFATLAVEVVNIAGRQLGFSMAGMDAYAGYCLAAGLVPRDGLRAAQRRPHPRHADPAAARMAAHAGGWKSLCLVIATLLSGYFAWFAARLVWGSYTFNDVSQNVDATPLWIPQLSMAIGLFGLALAFAEQLVYVLRFRTLPPQPNEAANIE